MFKTPKAFAVLLTSSLIVSTLTAWLPKVEAAEVTAQKADNFINSTCVNTRLGYLDRVYGNYSGIKPKLVELGIRHIRDGATSDDWIALVKDLAKSGIKTTVGIDPTYIGLIPNNNYWANSSNPTTINEFVKKVGTDVIDAVEGVNEIDLNWHQMKWRKSDSQNLSDDPPSPNFWGKYAASSARDTWNALKNDPQTAAVKVIGTSLARWYDYESPNPVGDLSAWVDWGNVHPYPFNGNSYGNRDPYNTIEQYYLFSNFPSQNIDEFPHALDVYSRPFPGKPMAATETGYFTGTGKNAISETVQAKYIPRLFLEYFRLGIVRTCTFELVDGGAHTTENWGLLHNDLSPKPAYTALKNLIGLLKDNGGDFTAGSLDYSFTFEPPNGYDRTDYVHSLLLQKSNGKYYLAIWHEISNNDISSIPPREIKPPAMPTTINFETPLKSAKIHALQTDGSVVSTSASVLNNSITLDVKDTVSIVELEASK